ncbi:MAG TPA: polymorphic toxin type 17 domain-containing protein [Candidatus Babeliales bacterium]|nr:polymorphic toxin type 17 domain-containing protein [Candidatus Babeliales bacterium]
MKKLFFLTLLSLISTNLLGINRPNNSINHLTKINELPNRGGLIRYIPPKNCSLTQGLPIVRLPGNKHGFRDKFDNIWVKGPSRTNGERKEWDVQLANKNKKCMKRLAAPDGNHLNISLTGRVTH